MKQQYLELIKEYQFTHLSSAYNIKRIYDYLFRHFDEDDVEIYLGKPFAFYTYFFALRDNQKDKKTCLKNIFPDLQKLNFNGVITEKQLKTFQKEYPKLIKHNFAFIDPTLGSSLSVAIGAELTGNNKKKIVIIPDSYLYMGEFWEGLNLSLQYNLENIELWIDFNNHNKMKNLNYSQDKIETILNEFHLKYKIFKG